MRLRVQLLGFGFAFAAGCAAPGVAAQPLPDCAKALVPDINDVRSDIQLLSSYLQIIDQSNFETAKQNASLQAAFVVYGIPFDVGADYSRFNQARSAFFQKIQYNQNYKDASTYVMQRVPPAAFKAYGDCILVQSARQFGPHLIPRNVTDELFILDMTWVAQPGVSKAKATWNLSGVAQQGSLPVNIVSGGTYPLVFKRTAKEHAAVTVTVGDLGSSFFMQYVKPITVTPPPREKYTQVRTYSTEGRDRQRVDAMCPAGYHVLERGACTISVPNVALTENSPVGKVGWQCAWASWQPVGVALEVRITCELDADK